MTATVPGWQGLDLAGGRYHVTAPILGGGMADVYRAWDRNLQTEVVIKVPLAELLRDAAFTSRFAREVRSLVRLQHPHIVKVIDVGEHAGMPFAVMQFLAGGSLRNRQLNAQGVAVPLSPGTLPGWLPGVAEALDFIHAQNFVHRDVKPANILFDGHGNAYLSDFGVIKAVEGSQEARSHLTQRGMVVGTLQYLAPEIFLARSYDGRADQYALAVTVYEVLAGRCPFRGGDAAEIMGQQMHHRPPGLHELPLGVGEGLARAVARGMAREPAERFPTCRQFAEAVLDNAHAPAAIPLGAGPSRTPVAGPAPATAAVRLECPLCQEIIGLTAADRGRPVRCSGCRAELTLSADLNRLTVIGSGSTRPGAPLHPPTPAPPPPAPSAVVGPLSFNLSVEDTSAAPVTPDNLIAGVYLPAPSGGMPGVTSAPIFFDDDHLHLTAPLPRRRNGPKVFAVVALGLLLLGGLGYGAYWALENLPGEDPPARVVGKDGPPARGAPKDQGRKPPRKPRPVAAPGTTVTVAQKGGGRYTTVGAALREVGADTVIKVRPGLYEESLVIDTPVEIVGDGPAKEIVIRSAGAPCVRVEADRAVLRGLTLLVKSGNGAPAFAVDVGPGKVLLEGCDVSSQTSGGVLVRGTRAEPVLRKCQVHDCKGPGVLVHGEAQGTLEDCEVAGNTGAGVEIREGANPVLRKCKVHDGGGVGILCRDRGKGKLDGCFVFANVQAGVDIRDAADPVLDGCRIHDGKADGVSVHAAGLGTLTDCDIDANAGPGVSIGRGGAPVLRTCKVHGGKQSGVLVTDRGKGTLDVCAVFDNAGSGVTIQEAGTPRLTACKISKNDAYGVHVTEGGRGTLENCFIFANTWAGVGVKDGGDPTLRKCTIHDGRMSGIAVFARGKGTLEGCEFYGNKGSQVYVRGGRLDLTGCTIRDGKSAGVLVARDGAGSLTDCTIRANALSGVEIDRGADPTLKGCTITAGLANGVFVHSGGRGTFDACAIHANANSGVCVQSDGNPTLAKCKIHGNKWHALSVSERGQGTLEDCDLYANTLAAVMTSSRGDPLLRKCRIGNGRQGGFLALDRGKGKLDDCTITGNVLAGVEIREGADPVIQDCRISKCLGSGVYVHGEGKGTLVGCDISGNALSGVHISSQGDPLLRRCKIHDGKEVGCLVSNSGAGTLENCDVFDNRQAGIEIRDGGNPTIRRCKINRNGTYGIYVHSKGLGKVVNSDLTDNSQGAWKVEKGSKLSVGGNKK